MTLLQIIQEFCRRTGLGSPAAAASSGDDQTLQLVGLLNEVLEDLEERKAFTFLQAVALFQSNGHSNQGPLTDIAVGFVKLMTPIFNRTTAEIIPGPISAESWQANEAGMYTISSTEFRVIGTNLYLKPAPPAGQLLSFEYQTNITVKNPSDGTYKQYFTRDTDTCLYPAKVLIKGLRWIWKKEKGLRYAEDFRSYEVAVTNMAGVDGWNKDIDIAGPDEHKPGIFVPEGNWRV